MRNLKIWNMVSRAVAAWIEDRGPSRGAAIAFYTLFSISPLLIIMTSIAGFFLGYGTVRSALMKQSSMVVGEAGAQVVQSILQSKPNPASSFFASFAGLVAMLIGSTSVFIELKNALDNIWKAGAKTSGGLWSFIRARLLALVITLAMTLLIMLSILFSAIVQDIVKFGEHFVPRHAFLLEALNFSFLFAMSTALFATIYKVLPSASIEWKDVWAGSAITSVLFTTGKTLIGFYLLHSATASIFGAAGSLILLLFWIYYSAQIFLLGAEFTKLYADYLDSRSGPAKIKT
jgi:membrane protein